MSDVAAETLEAMREKAEEYAQQREKHAQEAVRLSAAADAHQVASHQFAGAYDAAIALIALIEKKMTLAVR